VEGASCNESITVSRSTGGGDDLGGGSIVGIVAGLLVVIAVIAIILVVCKRRASAHWGAYSPSENEATIQNDLHQSEQEPPERLI
jgi:hypothetical protein